VTVRLAPRAGFALLLGSGGVQVDIAGDNVTRRRFRLDASGALPSASSTRYRGDVTS